MHSGAKWQNGQVTIFDLQPLPAGRVELHDARRQRRWIAELEPFEMGVIPVTEAQYAAFAETEALGERLPAGDVSWLDAIQFCNAASRREELTPAYILNESEVTWHISSSGYRLPTEAEWEYSCRAGVTGPHYGPLDQVAWTALDEVDHPQAVASKMANQFGLHDTLGNVWEWCWDLLDPARYGDYRVFRGGGYADPKWSVRASARRGGAPGMSHPDVGFRMARGGFSHDGTVQGWSADVDTERSALAGPLPSGWTPRRKQ